MKKFQFNKPDIVGISASSLCMVHCAIYPLIVSMGIFMKSSSSTPKYFGAKYQHTHVGWDWLDHIFIALAIWAVANSVKNTQSDFIKIGMWASVTVFSFAILLHHRFDWMLFISISSSFSLVIFHILNLKNYKKLNLHDK